MKCAFFDTFFKIPSSTYDMFIMYFYVFIIYCFPIKIVIGRASVLTWQCIKYAHA